MRYLADNSMPKGRVAVKKDGQVVAIAASLEMLPVIERALVVGGEVYAERETLSMVGLWQYGKGAYDRSLRAEAKRRRRANRRTA